MRDRILNTITKASSFQTVLWLLGSCLIMWYYVLPSAYSEILQDYKLTDIVNRGIQWLFIDQNTVLTYPSKELTMFSLRAELTAGMLENLLTFALFLTLLVFVQHKNNKFILPFKYMLLLPCFGFLADILESVFIIFSITGSFESTSTITFAKLSSLLKWVLYFITAMTIVRNVVVHSIKGKMAVRFKNP